jgi:hypothetical protein
MAEVNSTTSTDFNCYENVPSFYRDVLAETIDPGAALRKIIEKVQTAVNDKNNISTNGIVVYKNITSYPQTFINQLKKTTSSETSFTEYRVVLVEDGMSLEDLSIKDPTPHDRFKYFLSKYYVKSENIKNDIAIGQRVRIVFSDTKRTDGWISELI